LEIDDPDRLVGVVRCNRVLPVVAHVDAPRVLAHTDHLDDLVFTRIDLADHTEIAIGGVQITAVVSGRRDVDAFELPEVFGRVQLRHPRHFSNLYLLQQLVPTHVDHPDPMCPVVADV